MSNENRLMYDAEQGCLRAAGRLFRQAERRGDVQLIKWLLRVQRWHSRQIGVFSTKRFMLRVNLVESLRYHKADTRVGYPKRAPGRYKGALNA